MTNNPPTIDELRESFNRVYNGPDRLQREYDLVMEAERLGVPLDTYRRLYELRGEEHIDPYPKPKHWWQTPGDWGKWFGNLPKSKKLTLIRKGGFWVVKQSFFVTVAFGLINYLREAPKREKLAHYQAWQMINSAAGQKTSGGRIEALQDLAKDGVYLDGLDVSGAFLIGINLQKAELWRANLSNAKLGGANLSHAYLADVNLSNASLMSANLSNASLWSTNLSNAVLEDANLSNAVLEGVNLSHAVLEGVNLSYASIDCNIDGICTNFKGAKGITPQQIKQAKGWQDACYDPDVRKKLGLLPQNPKNCAGEEKK